MVAAVDGWYYVFQLIIFPIAAIIFGVCVRAFWREVEEGGWVLSARFIWFGCLVMSTFVFCILQLDPSSSLGIFEKPWRAFLAFFDSSLVINAIYATFYMYMIVIAKRHLKSVPVLHTCLWIVVNVFSTLFVGITCLAGAITDNHFWLAVGLLGLMTQELLLLAAMNVNLSRVNELFLELERTTNASFRIQRRKLLILRIALTGLITTAVIASLLAKNAGLNALWSSERVPVIGYDSEVFDVTYLLPDLLILSTHITLLYAMRRPAQSSKDSKMVVNLSSQNDSAATHASIHARDSKSVVCTKPAENTSSAPSSSASSSSASSSAASSSASSSSAASSASASSSSPPVATMV